MYMYVLLKSINIVFMASRLKILLRKAFPKLYYGKYLM